MESTHPWRTNCTQCHVEMARPEFDRSGTPAPATSGRGAYRSGAGSPAGWDEGGGGQTQANGLNMSAIGRIPLGASFNLLGRVGATYGRTRVSSLPGSGITAGRENGFGMHLGLGGEYVFNPQMSVVLQYELHDLKFAGGSRDHIGNTTLGVRYRF